MHPNTVRNQLKLLANNGLIEYKNGKWYPRVLDIEVAVSTLDYKRSKAGQRGALKSLRVTIYGSISSSELSIPGSLKYYIRQVISKSRKLINEGKRYVALDLLVHTLLPLRENAVLWLWKDNEFIYYEPKTGKFHSVKFPALAEFLKNLGFKEGLMVQHIYGHEEASRIIHNLFAKGHLSWVWSRSIFYGLKKLSLAQEGNYYVVELEYKDGVICLVLKDIYGNIINIYTILWSNNNNRPAPLNDKDKFKSIVIGKQHVKESNEESYFSK